MDRACGVLLAAACGDALGAGYEFGSAALDGPPGMIGGGLGGFAPGEWTDDTAQAVAIAEVAATGVDLRSEEALTSIARRLRGLVRRRAPRRGHPDEPGPLLGGPPTLRRGRCRRLPSRSTGGPVAAPATAP